EICADWPVRWRVSREVSGGHRVESWPDIEETGETYEENALLKASVVASMGGGPAIAADSGIEAAALGGAAGVRSARVAGEGATDEANLRLLLERVAPAEDRTARYVCVAACAWPDGDSVWVRATCEGRLIGEPRGSGGFGYDPIFVPNGDTRTMA